MNKVERVDLDGSVHEIASGMGTSEIDRPYAGGQYSASKTGVIAFTSGDPLHPNQVAVASAGHVRTLTELSSSLLQSKALAQVQKLPVRSEYDQRPMDAWMVTPPDFDPAKTYPMILEIHGGPFFGSRTTILDRRWLYAAHGYVVVYSNPRGSTLYGEDFKPYRQGLPWT